ncbi:hypothetical protein BCR32DRAFT_248807 [Anaeromyces robustus]|uniref:Transglutaminase-like domain-containing protein n=1 Tax=Anaeromyces robustus TaxID=1754192 RepID=A0A1Y1WSD5_9FUNG|nr:hypothetical protein BCR32DRAFT_248807 [Anaeromyces robustus]|eukprot:ORX76362.1 hypothetical protein BCR32DRAFT_248807 [Anaeromyces robustus]
MKLINIAYIIVLNIWMVYARPDYADEINKSDGKFHYWVSYETKTATIMGVEPKYANSNTLYVEPVLNVNGKVFTVNQIGAAAFSNNNVKNLIIPERVKKINISPNAFFNSYIETINFRCKEVTVTNELAFDGCNKHVHFKGNGVQSLVDNYSKYLLQKWGLPVNYQKYTDNSDPNDSKRLHDLYTLAKKLKEHVTYMESAAHSDTAASALLLKAGNSEGIARAFRTMSITMGILSHETYVGFDAKYYRWNYVKVKRDNQYRYWYNIDIVHSTYGSSYNKNVFRKVGEQKAILKKAYNLSSDKELDFNNWQIYENRYNYPEEWTYNTPYIYQLYSWMVRNRACCFAE